jgi:hypothetical protein
MSLVNLVLQKLQCSEAMLSTLHVKPMPLQTPTHKLAHHLRIIYYQHLDCKVEEIIKLSITSTAPTSD